jgi:alkylated DNA repair dioxygenase AlkB
MENLLEYKPGFYNEQECLDFMQLLKKNIQWKQETLTIFGKTVKTPRLTAWYGDIGIAYKYSGKQFFALSWTEELLAIKEKTELVSPVKFNSVLLNYYRDGNDSMGWHSDDEPELGKNPVIASVNFGQERRFDFRYKADHRIKHNLILANGSLLLMKGDLQHHWQHQIAKSKQGMKERINLTFRLIR